MSAPACSSCRHWLPGTGPGTHWCCEVLSGWRDGRELAELRPVLTSPAQAIIYTRPDYRCGEFEER